MAATSLYMFAIMPPPALSVDIHQLRVAFSEEYGFVKALRPPVHITMYPPFTLRDTEADVFEQQISNLQRWADHESPFPVYIANYDTFDNAHNPVLFLQILKSAKLSALHNSFLKELKKQITIGQPISFKPHITIGYRDINPEIFPEIKSLYAKRTFKASFECNAVHLWKHDGKNWQVLKTFPLRRIKDQLSLF